MLPAMAIAMRWDEGSLRGTTRLKTLARSSEKLGCADLFRRELRRWAQTPRPPGTGGKRQPCGLLREAQSDPKVRRKEAPALWAVATEGGKAT